MFSIVHFPVFIVKKKIWAAKVMFLVLSSKEFNSIIDDVEMADGGWVMVDDRI